MELCKLHLFSFSHITPGTNKRYGGIYSMVKKFIGWFVIFALAYAAHYFGLATLPVAFFAMHAGLVAAVIITLLLFCMFGKERALMKMGHLLVCMLRLAGGIVIVCAATTLAHHFLVVDFYKAYMIMTFGQCLCFNAFTPNNYSRANNESADPFDDSEIEVEDGPSN